MTPKDHPDASDAHEAAIDWWVHRRAARLTPEEAAKFTAWLAAPEHRAAFLDVEKMCGELDRLEEAPVAARSGGRGGRRLALAGLAAALLAVWLAPADVFLAWGADHRTAIGETRLVTLEDGSRVHLDARSAIAVHYEGVRRRVALLYGEAWFDVAPAPERPFVVEARGGTVTARGTSFDVAIEAEGVRVAVTEHSVGVASGGSETLVSEGQETVFDGVARAALPTPARLATATAWRRGKLTFEDRPLRDVLKALGRYRLGAVYCVPASLCGQRVTGVFDAGDPAQALREIEAYLGLEALRLTDYLIVLHE